MSVDERLAGHLVEAYAGERVMDANGRAGRMTTASERDLAAAIAFLLTELRTARERADALLEGIKLYLDDSDAIDAPAFFAHTLAVLLPDEDTQEADRG